jgi:hypothetical protein
MEAAQGAATGPPRRSPAGWVVENNVVLTDHWHGISFYGARNLRIVNNAVDPGPPWIMVTAHKGGTPSRDTLVRNNLTTDLSVSGDNVVRRREPAPARGPARLGVRWSNGLAASSGRAHRP